MLYGLQHRSFINWRFLMREWSGVFFQGEEFFESWCIGGLVKQPPNLHDPVSPLLPSTAAHCPRASCDQSSQSQAALGAGLTPSLAAVSEQCTGGQCMDSLSAAFSTERSGFSHYSWASSFPTQCSQAKVDRLSMRIINSNLLIQNWVSMGREEERPPVY